MTVDSLVVQAEALLEQLENLVLDHLPQKGDTSWTCQRTAIINALQEVDAVFNGLTEEDLVPSEDYGHMPRPR